MAGRVAADPAQGTPLLFDGTVRDNIGYGARGATDAQIQAAARAAGAHDFITALPDGYGTLAGQRGRMLSGGQRQRIAIARALLRDAPVLILDEPTTGLDPAAARQLAGLLRVAGAGRTTIVITHDLGLAATADEVLTIGGTPAGHGTPRGTGHPGRDTGHPAGHGTRQTAAHTDGPVRRLAGR